MVLLVSEKSHCNWECVLRKMKAYRFQNDFVSRRIRKAFSLMESIKLSILIRWHPNMPCSMYFVYLSVENMERWILITCTSPVLAAVRWSPWFSRPIGEHLGRGSHGGRTQNFNQFLLQPGVSLLHTVTLIMKQQTLNIGILEQQ